MVSRVEARAFAKINLTLEVLGRRNDGYHEVQTILQTIDLSDILTFENASSLVLESSDLTLWGRANLVWKTADSLRRATGYGGGARIYLEKHIPVGMGLGGGSSDAALTLICLNQLWNLGLGHEDLCELSAGLGSDIPFFLTGGTCLGTDRGEQITPLQPLPTLWLALLCPFAPPDEGAISKTGKMYSKLEPGDFTDGSHTKQLMKALEEGGFSEDLLFNVFESVHLRTFPGSIRMHRALLETGSAKVSLAGSGPAWYALAQSEVDAQGICNSLKTQGFEAYCVSTIQSPQGWPDRTLEGGVNS